MTSTATPITIPMPSLGENVTEGTVTRWLKQPGEFVDIDEALLEIATDKVDTEIASPAAGVLSEVLAHEDDVVEIGAPLATLTPAADDSARAATPPQDHSADSPPAVPIEQHAAEAATSVSATTPAPPAEIPVHHELPSARAATAAPDPGTVPNPESGTGPDTGGDRVEKLPRIRRTIAARMVQSLQTAAQLTTVVEVDLSAIAHLRTTQKDDFHRTTGHKLSYLPFFAKAAIEALADNPVINSSLDAEVTTATYHRACHLGMAVDSEKGLMVPVLRNADTLSIAGLAREIGLAAQRVRTATISPDELTGGTFTITNTGSRGALFDTPIINQPQSAILGTGTVVPRLSPTYDRAGNLTITVKPFVYLALSYDHRIVDGADAARYLGDVKDRLESGYSAAELR